MRNRTKLFSFVAALCLILSIAACRKDKDAEIFLLIQSGLANTDGKDSIDLDTALILHPTLTTRENITYQWQVNGKQEGTDSVFSFKSAEAGDYTIKFIATHSSGQATYEYHIRVWGKYENGIILVNEGWFGHDNGGVNFYRYGRDTIEQNVYQKENPGKDLGVTTESGVIFNNRLYLVSKQGPLVVTNAKTLKETGRIATLPAEGRSFLPVSNTTALLSTSDGVYPVDLGALTIGTKLSATSGETGTMRKEGNYVFITSQTEGTIVLNQSTYSLVKKFPTANQGLVKTSDGSLWAAGGDLLLKINPSTLDTTKITLPFAIGDVWFAWNEGTITSSGNALYIARTQPWGAGGNQIYKYIPGNISSLNTPIATLPTDQEFIGAAIRYNPWKDELAVTAVESGYGDHFSKNKLYRYSTNGTLKKTISYTGFYFPALPLFN